MSLRLKIHNVRRQGLTVVKTGKISGGINALFASYPDVWAVLKPALDVEGLSVGFGCASLEALGHEGEVVHMTMEVSDGAETEPHEFAMMVPEKILNSRGSSVTNNAQRVANAQSYLKRTALIHFFGMSAGNEDEVERMMPATDQTNIPGVVLINDKTTWQGLTDGMWGDVMSPLHDGKLITYHSTQGDKGMKLLWADFPDHPGLLAWAADWLQSAMQALELTWADIMEADPAAPSQMVACNSAQLRAACRIIQSKFQPKQTA